MTKPTAWYWYDAAAWLAGCSRMGQILRNYVPIVVLGLLPMEGAVSALVLAIYALD